MLVLEAGMLITRATFGLRSERAIVAGPSEVEVSLGLSAFGVEEASVLVGTQVGQASVLAATRSGKEAEAGLN